MPHIVTLRLKATVEIADAGSPDEAARLAQDLLAKRFLIEFPRVLPSAAGAGTLHLAFDAKPLVGVIGDGEDPAPDPELA